MSKETEALDRIQKGLGCTLEEAKEIYAYDCKVEKGEEPIPLTEEQKKVVKKMCGTGTRKTPTVYKLDNTGGKRSRKENPTKAGIIQHLFECLKDYDNVVITNKERQISFSCGDDNFELTLVQKRKK